MVRLLVSECLPDVALNLHIHHYEVSSVEAVCHDPAHKGSREHDRVWLLRNRPGGMADSRAKLPRF